jgi:enoyl-CoA hydratase/carnithine racemase
MTMSPQDTIQRPAPALAARRPVLVLTISNPAARNAMHPSLYRTAVALLREAAADRTVRAIVLAGEGEHFCGGGDVKRLADQRSRPREEQLGHLDALHDWVMAMQDAPQPVIAAVEGAAAGGGFSLCLGCDLIVAAEDAKFVMSYVKLALSPDGGGSDSLARALPPQAALELLLDGGVCSAQRLHAWGVVNRVVPHGEAFATALAGRSDWPPGLSMRRRASSNWCTPHAGARAATNSMPNAMPSSTTSTATNAARASKPSFRPAGHRNPE